MGVPIYSQISQNHDTPSLLAGQFFTFSNVKNIFPSSPAIGGKTWNGDGLNQKHESGAVGIHRKMSPTTSDPDGISVHF